MFMRGQGELPLAFFTPDHPRALLPAEQHINGPFSAVLVARADKSSDVLTRRALREPCGNLASQHADALRGMFPLAVNDEDATFSADAHRAKKKLQLSSRFLDAHPVQVEPTIDWVQASAQPAQQVYRQVDASPFDAEPVVGHLESRPGLDEPPQPRVDGICLGVGDLARAQRSLLGRLGSRDTNLRDAAARFVERRHARKEAMKLVRDVLGLFWRQARGRRVHRLLGPGLREFLPERA